LPESIHSFLKINAITINKSLSNLDLFTISKAIFENSWGIKDILEGKVIIEHNGEEEVIDVSDFIAQVGLRYSDRTRFWWPIKNSWIEYRNSLFSLSKKHSKVHSNGMVEHNISGIKFNEVRCSVEGSKPYYLSETLITESLYEFITCEDLSLRETNYPVRGINWKDAALFANKLSKLFGYDESYKISEKKVILISDHNGYRLPFKYQLEQVTEDTTLIESEDVWAVKSRGPTELGVYDSFGNLFQWCNDSHSGNCYSEINEMRSYYGNTYKNHNSFIPNKFHSWHKKTRLTDLIGIRLVRPYIVAL
jgi:hypothetical protein